MIFLAFFNMLNGDRLEICPFLLKVIYLNLLTNQDKWESLYPIKYTISNTSFNRNKKTHRKSFRIPRTHV